MPPAVALLSHPDCGLHDPGPGHHECPARLPALMRAVRADPDLSARLQELRAAPATEEDLLRVHTPRLMAQVSEAVEEARRQGGRVWLEEDTPVSAGSWEAALAATGCVIGAAEVVLDGQVPAAFALSRPPGHHATADRAMGFCLFNSVAVAIRRLQAQGRADQVLVIDWDAHHGNGTQEIFYQDPRVYVLSLHLSPDYPGTGTAAERGAGAGQGTTLNVPIRDGTLPESYRHEYQEALDQVLSSFRPDLVMISAGFDCLSGDPEGGVLLEPRDLHLLTTDLLDRIPAKAQGRVVAALEGGYALGRIGAGLREMLRALSGLPPSTREG